MVELLLALGKQHLNLTCEGATTNYTTNPLPNRKFESWNPSPDVKPGDLEYYQKQVYKHGTRCWNGPERNVVVSSPFSFFPTPTPRGDPRSYYLLSVAVNAVG